MSDIQRKGKCPICKKETDSLEPHLQQHIKSSYAREVEVYHQTQEAVAIYKKLFKTAP